MKQLCYLCEEWYVPTDEVLKAWIDTGYDWDPANWLCPGCEEALDSIKTDFDEHYYEDEEDYEHPF